MHFSSVLGLVLGTANALSILQEAQPGRPSARSGYNEYPPAPSPEPINVVELPLPPVVPEDTVGSCTTEINLHGTGCMGRFSSLQNGNFLPDGTHVLAILNFTGAPSPPDPASIYTGVQLIVVKSDGTKFSSGDAWKCITCDVPYDHQVGRTTAMDYPQAFRSGTKALVGTNIVDCGLDQLADCKSETTYIYPIRWNVRADGSGPGGNIRELRIHPDGVHLGFNSFTSFGGTLGQYAYFGRIEFNPSPTTGEPLSPRYDLVNVYRLASPDNPPTLTVKDDQIFINTSAITVGELRGFSGTGKEVTYIGYPAESSNIDVFAADLSTGRVRRLTSNPGYVDPVDISPDENWSVVIDTRSTDRQTFISGMRHIPPLTDLVTVSAVSSVRNNGQRRFFQPWIIDRYGDRGAYQGQQVNAAGDGSLGSVNDPEWNGMADPKWSLDGTAIVYWQALTISPACGGINPLPCPNSTADGGRVRRLMLARLTSRTPIPNAPVKIADDAIPWGTLYEPGSPDPGPPPHPPQGTYTLTGKVSGSAEVNITETADKLAVDTVSVEYTNFSNDGINILSGNELISQSFPSLTISKLDWYSNLTSTGETDSTKITSTEGFHLQIDVLENLFEADGTLTTTIDGTVYLQPANGT